MKIIRKIKQMSLFSKNARLRSKSIGFVPTMGALHEGHLGLIRKARRENDTVAVSIFVNPAQFGAREDLKKYPRDLKRDAKLCKKAGVDIIFCPHAKDMYRNGYNTYISVLGLSDVLCGRFRPGHFKGVATIVNKLFNIIQPDTAYFGQKDAQQAVIIKRMVEDLNIPVKIRMMPTVRERDGLAMSSRNTYLNKDERKDAAVLYQALILARNSIKAGIKDAAQITSRMRQLIQKKKTTKIDYISIVGPDNLKPVKKIPRICLVALAVWVGKTRLIDNLMIKS